MAVGAPAGLEKLRGAEVSRAFAALMYLRVVVMLVGVSLMLWYWATTGRSTLRLLLIFGAFVLPALFYIAVLHRRGRRPGALRTPGLRAFGVTTLICVASALTGGLDSPFVIFFPATIAAMAVGEDRREIFIAAGMQLAGVPLLSLAGGSRPAFTIGMLAFGVLVGMSLGLAIRAMFDRILMRALQARDDLLRMHSEQLQALTSFSSEIAHELKTPLASIKGLTGLALMELREPARAAERLEVLRSEALRMQRLLDDFLDFSRPLSPLALQTADPLRIGEEVVDLFQGLARERQISIQLSGTAAGLRCDPLKIKQVLINLVQNAVDASGVGSEIEVEIVPGPIETSIRVLDRGHGLSSEVARRVFEPGVTTKPRGSGLGLTIARSIAKQHGGSLDLQGREGGGCVAELVLPRSGEVAPRAGRAA